MVLVQEPYLYKNKPAIQPLSAKKYYTKNPNNRTAIYTSKNINAWIIEHLSNKDATVIVCKIEGRTTVIASIYMDYNDTSPFVKDWVQDIIDYANDKGYAILLGIDSNCHSTLYGLETNRRGEELEDFIAKNRLYVENIGTTPTFNTKWVTSIIDITLTSHMAMSVKNWQVSQEYNGSDHNSIEFELDKEKVIIEEQCQYHKADWNLFANDLILLLPTA